MTPRTIWLHLRIPFSFFLLPIYWFAISQSTNPDPGRAIAVLLIVHLLLYPASNAYNSYFDKDEDSIGGLEKPPPVTKALYWASWVLDIVALVLGVFVNWAFVLYLLVYGFVTKAYSYDGIRLKKYPILSWLLISTLQGGITYVMTYVAVNNLPLATVMKPEILFGGLLGVLNLMALYPVTQVYQHHEDARRGDMTLSRLLGIRGTFVYTMAVFAVAVLAFYVYFEGSYFFYVYVACLLPAMLFFLYWFRQVCQDGRRANYRMTMRMMWTSGVCQNIFFFLLIFLTHS